MFVRYSSETAAQGEQDESRKNVGQDGCWLRDGNDLQVPFMRKQVISTEEWYQ
ncbi:MAG: hypothetical protein H0X40_03865 [Chthoniobacterales bacterium]|nr:hypothetical protein [Chthoniobacterales bacterium]